MSIIMACQMGMMWCDQQDPMVPPPSLSPPSRLITTVYPMNTHVRPVRSLFILKAHR